MIKIEIPKDFYERKGEVTVREMKDMLLDMMEQLEAIEENYKYDLVNDYRLIEENKRLKDHIKKLESETKTLEKERGNDRDKTN